MATGLENAVRHVRVLAGMPKGNSSQDELLLARFVATQDQASFATLVRRHGPMVLGVCRRVLGNYHDADDAFQATFLVFARKAALIRQGALGNWLHAVAYRTAISARSSISKIRRREKQVDSIPDREDWPSGTPDWQPLLDCALTQLGESHRAAIVLCDLEGLSRMEAARQLQIPEGTLSSRLNRGHVLLAKRLRRLGISSAGAIFSLVIAECAPASIQRELVNRTCKSAWLVSNGELAALSTPLRILMNGVLKTMSIDKLLPVVGALCVAASLACGLSYLYASPAEQGTDSSVSSGTNRLETQAPDLRAQVTKGHRANLKAIRSIYADLFIKMVGKDGSKTTVRKAEGEFWEAGGKTRLWERMVEEDGHSRTGGREHILVETTEDCLLEGGNCLTLSRRIEDGGPDQPFLAEIDRRSFARLGHMDYWTRMGFVLSERPNRFNADIFEDPVSVMEIRTHKQGTEDVLEVTLQQEKETIELQINPRLGYIVTRMERWHGQAKQESKSWLVLTVDGIQECEPGIFLPTHSKRTIRLPDQLTSTVETFVNILEVNKSLPKDCFDSPIPEGVTTFDNVKRLRYTMGPDGNPSPNRPVTKLSKRP